jgi:hypothetical protein
MYQVKYKSQDFIGFLIPRSMFFSSYIKLLICNMGMITIMIIIIQVVLQITLYLGNHSAKYKVLYKSNKLLPLVPFLTCILIIPTKVLANDRLEVLSLTVTCAFSYECKSLTLLYTVIITMCLLISSSQQPCKLVL